MRARRWATARAAGRAAGGTRDLDLKLGAEPLCVGATPDGEHELQCRFVVGADGRLSCVRKALDLELERLPVLNHIVGLLIDDLSTPTRSTT